MLFYETFLYIFESTHKLKSELASAVTKARHDDEIKVVVITGAGEKEFSAGADISQFVKCTAIDVLNTLLKMAKIAVNKAFESPLSVGMEGEKELFAMCFGTEDQKEGARAFLEKRKPQWSEK